MNDLDEWISVAASSLRTDALWQDRVSVSEPKHPGGGCVIDIDTDRIIAQFVVWPTWAYEASALSVKSGEPFHFDNKPDADEQILSEGWRRFLEAITAAECGRRPH